MFLHFNKKLVCHLTGFAPFLRTKIEPIKSFICRSKSYYSDLGLESSASVKDIKAAYYSLSLKYHPDKNQGCTESTKKFREITEAYETLSNPERKRIYDRDLNVYGRSDFKNNFQSRSSTYTGSSPRTGRTKHYNYDEHFRQHYEEYMRQRMNEQEDLRRRFEAQMRYRQGNPHSWSSNFSTENQYRIRRRQALWKNRAFVSLLTFWVFMFIFSELITVKNPDNTPPRTIYYKTTKDDSKDGT